MNPQYFYYIEIEPNRFKPVIWSKLMEHDKAAFHGEVKENERVVQLKPELMASDADEMGGASEFFALLFCFIQYTCPSNLILTWLLVGAFLKLFLLAIYINIGSVILFQNTFAIT